MLTLRQAQEAEATERSGLAYCVGETVRIRRLLDGAIRSQEVAAERVYKAAALVDQLELAAS